MLSRLLPKVWRKVSITVPWRPFYHCMKEAHDEPLPAFTGAKLLLVAPYQQLGVLIVQLSQNPSLCSSVLPSLHGWPVCVRGLLLSFVQRNMKYNCMTA
jgi:hypothetical protein